MPNIWTTYFRQTMFASYYLYYISISIAIFQHYIKVLGMLYPL